MKHIQTFESFLHESIRVRSTDSLEKMSQEELEKYLTDVKKYIPTIDPGNKERIDQMQKYQVTVSNVLGKKTGKSGDTNPLNIPHVDTWHQAQNALDSDDKDKAIDLMTKAAEQAEKLAREKQDASHAGDANYYRGTVAWLKGDWDEVKRYADDKYVKMTGNDEVLQRLLKNKGQTYKEAYAQK